jgi:D-arabinose 1-dehydrogenase-like Zn-dependent alcohol dehydrogenase
MTFQMNSRGSEDVLPYAIKHKNRDGCTFVVIDKLGTDAVIDFVNASKTVETDMQLLRRRARLVLVGLFGGELKLSLITMPTRAYKIIGSYTGSISEMIELIIG